MSKEVSVQTRWRVRAPYYVERFLVFKRGDDKDDRRQCLPALKTVWVRYTMVTGETVPVALWGRRGGVVVSSPSVDEVLPPPSVSGASLGNPEGLWGSIRDNRGFAGLGPRSAA